MNTVTPKPDVALFKTVDGQQIILCEATYKEAVQRCWHDPDLEIEDLPTQKEGN